MKKDQPIHSDRSCRMMNPGPAGETRHPLDQRDPIAARPARRVRYRPEPEDLLGPVHGRCSPGRQRRSDPERIALIRVEFHLTP